MLSLPLCDYKYNASDCRNGAVVKQKFGEALESCCLTGSVENQVDSLCKHVMKSAEIISNGDAVQEVDKEVIELIPVPDTENTSDGHGAPEKCVFNDSETGFGQAKLILFEDADINFPEDRGFIAAIQQITEKAKGPVILTSNSTKLILPDNLGRLELCFTMPSPEVLLHHLYMKTYGLQLFDIEAGHSVLPTMIPWDLPSQLSELVEKEFSKTLSITEDDSTLMEVMEEELENNIYNGLEIHNKEMDSMEEKKEVMLSRNLPIYDCYGFISPPDPAGDSYNSSGTPVSSSRRAPKNKSNVVMSSDSEEEQFNIHPSLVQEKNVSCELFIKEDWRILSHCPSIQNGLNPPRDQLLCSDAEKCEDGGFHCFETSNDLEMETCKYMDVSYVPKSSFVPETEIGNGMELFSRTVSYTDVAETTEVSVSCELSEDLVEVNNYCNFIDKLVKTSDMFDGTCSITAEASHKEVENSQTEYDEAASSGHAVMDECSRMNFTKKILFYCDVISQAELLLSKCQIQYSFELLKIPSEDSNAFSWCDEQLQMVDTVSQHGICLYAKDIDAIGSKLDFEYRVDLSQEMLSSSASAMAFGRLLEHDARASSTSVDGKRLEMSPSKRELVNPQSDVFLA
ncbi:Adenine nucleotide alpha hydrolases-like superfamily protein [Hibiscus syriacus]|uniref:Adenine nucleotide alpha hydrolases-like superfamily protein n=1 Tax=Hibiscus syriacus TaxID=106335 RepID=A0A6A2ZU05_HIBSY|nr:Adenine nucleotide alpha hydrolases-like superfamily protein [Hibiscus syriacus]